MKVYNKQFPEHSFLILLPEFREQARKWNFSKRSFSFPWHDEVTATQIPPSVQVLKGGGPHPSLHPQSKVDPKIKTVVVLEFEQGRQAVRVVS